MSLLVMLVACGPSADDADTGLPPVPDPSIELGTGETAFEPVDDGDELFVILGPQGGFHFLGSLQAAGIEGGNPDDLHDPSNPTTTFRVFRDGEQVDVGIFIVQGLDPVDGVHHTYEMTGRFVILIDGVGPTLDGVDVDMEVEVTDANGEVVTDRHTIHAVHHPLNR